MTKIKELTKNTLFQLKNENIPTLPENYFIEFRKQALSSNTKIEEFDLFEKITQSLTKEEKESSKINSFNDIANILVERTTNEELKKLVEVFEELLTPSVDYTFVEEIEKFIVDILENPKNITSNKTISNLKKISKQRINSDRKVLKDKTDDIVKLTSLMGRYFDKTLSSSNNSSEEIMKIKDELISLNISNSSHRELKIVQKKLIDTIYKIENSIKENKELVTNNKEKFNYLYKQIEVLQKELILTKEEHQVDYLTGLLNRRAYHHEMEKMEKNFSMFQNNYAIVFYDIDHFKNINDNYGHTCGDAVLKSFSGILKNLTRKEDVIARYGGEEFIALINYQEEIEIERYMKRLKKTLNNSNFIYKDTSIKLKFSAGISVRNKYDSFLEAKKMADELLYKAKHKGRDKIIFDSGIEL